MIKHLAATRRNRTFLSLGIVAVLVGGMLGTFPRGENETLEAQADPLTIAAAGDICENSSAVSRCSATAALIMRRDPHHVLTLGDQQYREPSGQATLSQYNQYYNPRWGPFKKKTYPTPGNHDNVSSGYSTYFDGAAPGTQIPRNYERDLGEWRVVSVDSNNISGARTFVQNLSATEDHRVFIWHHSPYAQASDHDDMLNVRPLYNDAVNKGADVILYSHDHIYNRGFKDVPFFLVGTGGAEMHDDFCSPQRIPTPEVQRCIQQRTGVLFLTLQSNGSFDYDFSEPNGTSLDAGHISHW
jgi:hypothetical protein